MKQTKALDHDQRDHITTAKALLDSTVRPIDGALRDLEAKQAELDAKRAELLEKKAHAEMRYNMSLGLTLRRQGFSVECAPSLVLGEDLAWISWEDGKPEGSAPAPTEKPNEKKPAGKLERFPAKPDAHAHKAESTEEPKAPEAPKDEVK